MKCTILTTPATIALAKGRGTGYSVFERNETFVAMRNPGVRPTPDENFQKEASFMKNKADTYAVKTNVFKSYIDG